MTLQSKVERFVDYVCQRVKNDDKAFVAAFRRADNPGTKRQAWGYLTKFVDFEDEREILSYSLVGASIAKAKVENNGKNSLGTVLASCYKNGRDDDQAQAKLRRILACQDLKELIRVLRPILSLINSKGNSRNLDFARLLKDLLSFHKYESREKSKSGWAKYFYNYQKEELVDDRQHAGA